MKSPYKPPTLQRIVRHSQRVFTHAVVDACVIALSYLMALVIYWIDMPNAPLTNIGLFITAAGFVFILSLYTFGVYHRLWSRSSGHEIVAIVRAAIAATLIHILLLLTIIRPTPLPFYIIFMANTFSLAGFVIVRYRSRLVTALHWRWRAVVNGEFPKQKIRVLIIGAGESGQTLAMRLKYRFQDHHNYLLVGFIDDDPTKQSMLVEGCRVLGTRHDIVRLSDTLAIDLIVVAIHNISGQEFRSILTLCESTKAMIKVIPSLQQLVDAQYTTGLLRDVQAEDLIGRSPISRHEAVDMTPITGKTILVTGASGSIGAELSRQIMDYAPARAILLDNNESGLHDLTIELRAKHPALQIIAVLSDITDRAAIAQVFAQHCPQIVLHAAAYKHVPLLEDYPQEAIRVNVGGTRNLVELAQSAQVERFVLISTDKAVNPSSVMGASKRICELMLHALMQDPKTTTRFTAVRFGNVLGSRGSVVQTFNRQIDNGGAVTVTDREMTRYFISIPEAVNLILHAACLTEGDDIFVLQMGEVVRILELAERMIRLRGLRPYKDIAIKFTGIRPGEKMHEELFLGVEEPRTTLHPKILQIDGWDEDFDSRDFWSQIDALQARDRTDYPKPMLPELHKIVKPERIPVVYDTSTPTKMPEERDRAASLENNIPIS